MTVTGSKWHIVIYVFVGVVAGGALSGMLQSRQPRVEPVRGGSPQPPEPRLVRSQESSREELDALRQRLRVVESHMQERPDAGTAARIELPRSPQSHTAQELQAIRERSLLAFRQEVADLQSRFRHESVDTQWSPPMVASLRRDLEQRSESMRFHVTGLECRSSVCAAEVVWRTVEDARRHGGSLAEQFFSSACARTIAFDEGALPDEGPVSAQLLVDCKMFRDRGMDGLTPFSNNDIERR